MLKELWFCSNFGMIDIDSLFMFLSEEDNLKFVIMIGLFDLI